MKLSSTDQISVCVASFKHSIYHTLSWSSNIDLGFVIVDIGSILVQNDVIAQGSLLEKSPIPALAKGWQTDICLLLYSFASIFTGC